EISSHFVSLRTNWMTACVTAKFPHAQVVDLSELLRPEVFLNALKQETARALKVR
ncbi:hypothetical protein Pmar_PMAR015455, partial [Perkinsus marinus ATCC 50983]